MAITDAPIHPSLAVRDLERARAWYADKLGWEPARDFPGLLVYEVGDSYFTLFTTTYAGTAKNTVMNWNVRDLSAEMGRLRDGGVTFEEYDFGEVKTVDGVMADPVGGNELSADRQSYLYFLVAQDGTFLVKHRANNEAVHDVVAKTAHAAVVQPGADGRRHGQHRHVGQAVVGEQAAHVGDCVGHVRGGQPFKDAKGPKNR